MKRVHSVTALLRVSVVRWIHIQLVGVCFPYMCWRVSCIYRFYRWIYSHIISFFLLRLNPILRICIISYINIIDVYPAAALYWTRNINRIRSDLHINIYRYLFFRFVSRWVNSHLKLLYSTVITLNRNVAAALLHIYLLRGTVSEYNSYHSLRLSFYRKADRCCIAEIII